MNNPPSSKALLYRILLAVMAFALIVFNICLPHSNDVLISFGSSFQADYFGTFPANVYKSWNLRGIGYKVFLYILYKITGSPVHTGFKNFEVFTRAYYYIFTSVISLLFFRILRSSLIAEGLDWIKCYFIFMLCATAIVAYEILQPEDIATYCTLGMLSFALANGRVLNWLSGLFIPILLSLKIITVLYAGFVFLILIFLYPQSKQRLVNFVVSCALFSLGTMLFYFFIIPQEISDTIHATLFQHSFVLNSKIFLDFFRNFPRTFSFSACFLPGFVSGFYLMWISRRKIRTVLIILGFWLLGFCYVVIQGRFFAYHYLVFMPGSVLFICTAIRSLTSKYRSMEYTPVACIIAIWVAAALVHIKVPGIDPSANDLKYLKSYRSQLDLCVNLEKNYNLNSEKEVLSLTNGFFNYFIQTKSYLRYYFPLPVQAIVNNPKLPAEPIYSEVCNEILKYNGKYIVLDKNWFQLNYVLGLREKLNREYTLIFQSNINIDHQLVLYKKLGS